MFRVIPCPLLLPSCHRKILRLLRDLPSFYCIEIKQNSSVTFLSLPSLFLSLALFFVIILILILPRDGSETTGIPNREAFIIDPYSNLRKFFFNVVRNNVRLFVTMRCNMPDPIQAFVSRSALCAVN